MPTVKTLDLFQFLHGSSDDQMYFATHLHESLQELGFAVVRNHGVRRWTTAAATDYAKALFAQSAETLAGLISPADDCQRGYAPFGRETAVGHTVPDQKVFFSIGREGNPGNPLHEPYLAQTNIWPSDFVLPGFKSATLALYAEMELCAKVLSTALSVALQLPDDLLPSLTEEGDTVLRYVHYLAMPANAPEAAMRAAPHQNINLLTLFPGSLLQGLEIRTRSGQWVAAGEQRGEIVVSVGDMLSRLTNGTLPSTTDRVLNPRDSSGACTSIQMFWHGHPDAVLSVPRRFRGRRFPKAPPDITCGQFLRERLLQIGNIKAA